MPIKIVTANTASQFDQDTLRNALDLYSGAIHYAPTLSEVSADYRAIEIANMAHYSALLDVAFSSVDTSQGSPVNAALAVIVTKKIPSKREYRVYAHASSAESRNVAPFFAFAPLGAPVRKEGDHRYSLLRTMARTRDAVLDNTYHFLRPKGEEQVSIDAHRAASAFSWNDLIMVRQVNATTLLFVIQAVLEESVLLTRWPGELTTQARYCGSNDCTGFFPRDQIELVTPVKEMVL